MTDVMLNIILGAVGSIVATIVLYLLSNLYIIGYKKDFLFAYRYTYDIVFRIENLHSYFNDYNLIMEQVDLLRQYTYKMYKSLSLLSLWTKPNSKKLVITLLNDIILFCEKSNNITIGYNDKEEWEFRLRRISRYLYRCSFYKEENISTVRKELELILNLTKERNICNAMNITFCDYIKFTSNHVNSKPIAELFVDECIDANSYGRKDDYTELCKHCFTKDQLIKILQKEMGKKNCGSSNVNRA